MKFSPEVPSLDHVQTLRFHIVSKLISLRIGHCSHWFGTSRSKKRCSSVPMKIESLRFRDGNGNLYGRALFLLQCACAGQGNLHFGDLFWRARLQNITFEVFEKTPPCLLNLPHLPLLKSEFTQIFFA